MDALLDKTTMETHNATRTGSRRCRVAVLILQVVAALAAVPVLFLLGSHFCGHRHHRFSTRAFHTNANDLVDYDAYLKLMIETHNVPPTGYLPVLGSDKKDDKKVDPQPFDLDAVFGDNMVLQQGNQAAIYGFLGPSCANVQLDLLLDGSQLVFHADVAIINATQQPFGEGWGVRPCSRKDCKGKYDMNPFNPWNEPLASWKIILPAQQPGGNYTIVAQCLPKQEEKQRDPMVVSITNVTFGDVWYCSGQSNMWLPLQFTFHRNQTMQAILDDGKYHNIRIMAGPSAMNPYGRDEKDWNPGYGKVGGTNPWMTALQAVTTPASGTKKEDERDIQKSAFTTFGAACWYFGQALVDQGLDIPIGLANTAIGGQRIQEFMNNATIDQCQNRSGAMQPTTERWWEGQLYATQVLPFADMTVKGWVWYQGENNMHDIKGNAAAHVGYGCELPLLIHSWRELWCQIPGTTDPLAPFGVVTLATGGDEGGPDIGTMRLAQTGNYGVLPSPEIPNTFVAHAHDLADPWGPDRGLCFDVSCCDVPQRKQKFDPKKCSNETLRQACQAESGACPAAYGTDTFMGGIHPRSKKWVGARLGIAAYNLVYGGTDAFTGPTLQGCSIMKQQRQQDGDNDDKSVLEVRFNTSLLRGEDLVVLPYQPSSVTPDRYKIPSGGSQLWVQTNASLFCLEPTLCDNADPKHPLYCCEPWAGGSQDPPSKFDKGVLDKEWILVNFSLASNTKNAILVDLSPLQGATPTAIRYAWGHVYCCDFTDPDLWVTHGCIASCPLQASKNQLPANPFQAKIVDGKCECVAPQVCSDEGGDEANTVNEVAVHEPIAVVKD